MVLAMKSLWKVVSYNYFRVKRFLIISITYLSRCLEYFVAKVCSRGWNCFRENNFYWLYQVSGQTIFFSSHKHIWTTIKQQLSPISTLDCLYSKDGSTTWTPTFSKTSNILYPLHIETQNVEILQPSFEKSQICLLLRWFCAVMK